MSTTTQIVLGIFVGLAVAFALVALSVHLSANSGPVSPDQREAPDVTFSPGVAPLPQAKPVQLGDTKQMPGPGDETRVGNGSQS